MGRIIGAVVALALILSGGVLALQGLGHLGGTAVSGDSARAILGPALAGLGVALGIVMMQNRNRG